MVGHRPELLYFLVLLCIVGAHEGAKKKTKITFKHISTIYENYFYANAETIDITEFFIYFI